MKKWRRKALVRISMSTLHIIASSTLTLKLEMAVTISEIKCHLGPVPYIMSISIELRGLATRH